MTEKARIRQMPKKGWSWFPNSLLPRYGKKMKAHGIAVYMVLAQHADNDSQTSYPSKSLIAELTGMSRRQVRKELKKLESLRLVHIAGQKTNGRTSTNRYTLLRIPVAAHQERSAGDAPRSVEEVPGGDADDAPPSALEVEASAPGAPEQHVVTRLKEHRPTPTTPSSLCGADLSSETDVGVGEGIPYQFEQLIEALLITDEKRVASVYAAYRKEPSRVMTWALLLASPEYRDSCDIETGSGFFLYVLNHGVKEPTLASPHPDDTCSYCGDSGCIEIQDNPKGPRELTIHSCPVCGKTDPRYALPEEFGDDLEA